MAGDELGAVVIGTGFGVLTHLRALRAAGFEVRALVGRDPEKTRQRAALFDVPKGLTRLDDALSLPGVDVVAIATPPHTHCNLVLAAAAAGKHVVCEKPFAKDASEAERMLESVARAGVVHLMGTEFRFASGQALATRAVREGMIGEPRFATFVFHMPALADPSAEVPHWWTQREDGGGWLGAYASHVIDHARLMLGEFAGVSASLALLSDRTDWTADDSYSVHFRTRSGAAGVLQGTAAAYGPFVMTTRVVGSRGTLWMEGDGVFVADADGQRALEMPDDLVLPPPSPPPAELLETAYDMLHSMGIDLPPYVRLYEVLRARIRGEDVPADPVAGTFADGLEGQRVLDAIRQASEQVLWVAIE